MPLRALEIARTALSSYQTALEVTAQNLANIQTEGYGRRRVLLSAQSNDGGILTQSPVMGGMGVLAERIERAGDAIVEAQLRTDLGRLGLAEGRERSLLRAEALFTDLSEHGLSNALDEFFSRLQGLAAQPESMVARRGVITSAQRLTDGLVERYGDLERLRFEYDTQVETTVNEINRLAHEVALLNTRAAALGPRAGASTVLDERDRALSRLATLVGAEAKPQAGGLVDVLIGGRRLVAGATVHELGAEVDPLTGMRQVVFGEGGPVVQGLRGELGGVLAARDADLPSYLASLDELADALRTEINAVHQTGIGLDGTTGVDFFTGGPGVAGLAVNEVLVQAPQAIGASATGAPGDGAVAMQLAELRAKLAVGGGTETFQSFYAELVGQVGADVAEAEEAKTACMGIVEGLRMELDSVIGVSLDEEAINMVKYQQAFNAAARVVSLVADLAQTVFEAASWR